MGRISHVKELLSSSFLTRRMNTGKIFFKSGLSLTLPDTSRTGLGGPAGGIVVKKKRYMLNARYGLLSGGHVRPRRPVRIPYHHRNCEAVSTVSARVSR